MILTVTLNAAIDRTVAVPSFRQGNRHRAVEAEPVAFGERFEGVDQTEEFHVVEHEPRVCIITKFDDEIPRRVEHPLYLGDVVATDELSW